MSSSKLDKIPNVDIDSSGKFKYILIRVTDPESKKEKYIVRGYARCDYHSDIFDLVEPKITSVKCKAQCVGGGRIRHLPDEKSLLIFGYSQGFGQADHSITERILKEMYPNYTDISWTNEGY